MRIAVVCPYDLGAPGGVQQLCRELTRRLAETGREAVLVGPGADDGIDVGRSVSVPGNRSRAPIALSPLAWRRVGEAVADADVVHVHEPLMPLVGWAALRSGRPTVATFHAAVAPWTRRLYSAASGPAGRLLGRAVLTAVSPAALAGLPDRWGPVTIVPNALDVPSYDLDLPRDPRRVVFLGRDDPRKGLDVLLAAWPFVRLAHPSAELAVLGASRSSAPEGVRFLGRVDETVKRREMASAAIHATPNLGGESFGIVVAEGMAAGCAVVASDLTAFRSVGGDAVTYVPAGDSEALAERISRLLSARDRMAELGRAARARVERFDWSNVLGRYEESYAKAANLDS